jgi:hypothetical protein
VKIEQRNQTDVERWDVDEILDSINEGKIKRSIIEIPTFQRNLAWSKAQKDAFIDSLKKGFPIGALLLYEKQAINNSSDGIKRYLLIDGLQRTNAIKEYCKHPTRFFQIEDIDIEFIANLIDRVHTLCVKDLDKDKVLEFIYEWIHNKNGLEEKDGFSGLHLAGEINEYFQLQLSMKNITLELSPLTIPFIDKIKLEANIDKLKLPILIFRGDTNNLPEIFKRINKQGTQLNKYQIFAAVWEEKGQIEIKNKDVRDKIKEKYDSLVNDNFIVDGYNKDESAFHSSKFNYFEYVFGLGKLLTNKDEYKYLFPNSKKSDVSESIGFNLLSSCLTGNVKSISEIPSELSKVNLEDLEVALLDSITEAKNILKPFIEIKTNKKTGNIKPEIFHTEMHIVAIIAKIFRIKYDEKLKERPEWKSCKKNLLDNIKFYYLYDIISNTWKGSGDTQVNNILKPGSRYEQMLHQKDWDTKLDDWFEQQLKEQSNDRSPVTPSQMLFLNYIYTHTHSCYRTMSPIEDHIEHIIPVNRLKSIAPTPINAIANLGLLEKGINISKQDFTIFEYFSNISSELKHITNYKTSKDKSLAKYSKTHPELKCFNNQVDLDKFIKSSIREAEKDLFIKESELDFLNTLDSASYEKFLRKRFKSLKQKFFSENNIPM